MKKNKEKKDPLRPKEDVKIEDKDSGFLKTLEKIVEKEKVSKVTFDFSQFPNFNFQDQIGSLPEEVQENHKELSEFFDSVLAPNQELHMVYPPNREIIIEETKNIDDVTLQQIRNRVYDFVVYGKPLY